MQPTEFFQKEIERLKGLFNSGDPAAVYEAALLCLWNELPMPTWTAQMVEAAIKREYVQGSKGRGQPNAAISSERWRADSTIASVYNSMMSGGAVFLARFHGEAVPQTKERGYQLTAQYLSEIKFEGRQHTADSVKKVMLRNEGTKKGQN